VITRRSKASTRFREASANKEAAKGAVEKVVPEPVVSEADAISETSQKPEASAHVQEAAAKSAVRDALEKVTPPPAEPVVGVTAAISETITMTADTVAAGAEDVMTPTAVAETLKPNLMLGVKTVIKSPEDFVALGAANVEAFVKSGQIWTAGVQELMNQFATARKVAFDEFVSTLMAVKSAKSVTEAIDVQSKFATSMVEKALAESSTLISTSMRLTEQTLAPINAHVTSAR
jgi:phasin family protein